MPKANALRRFFKWLIGVPLLVLAIGFAIANRRFVELSFDPFSQDAPYASIAMPLWLLFFIGMIAGVLLGWAGCWFAQAKWRKRVREQDATIRTLSAERDNLKAATTPSTETEIVPMAPGWM
jgi:uncharacterized integral membrane protein